MSPPSVQAESSPSVVVAVLVDDTAALLDTLAAVDAQVYEPVRRFIVGGAAAARTAAETASVEWSPSAAALVEQLDPRIEYLWFIRSGVRPRPDALRALVVEAERAGAAVAGSKLLSAERPDELVSVGWATDIYGTTYIGLDDGEVDQGQYDVVRDVAAVPGTSLLIRRDLASGIGGIDRKLAPAPAAIDLCQRARLRGARVVVVPSSEVLVPDTGRRSPRWRDEAGRIRAMLKAYSWLTLLWAIPLRFLIGLVEAAVAPFLGRWTLFAFLRAWIWNVVQLPSTLLARRSSRSGMVVGDAELFRYQLGGSATLRSLSADLTDRFRQRLPGEATASLLELTEELRRPGFVSAVVVLLATAFGTRTVWRSGLPPAGHFLRMPDDGLATLESYAGGWNPAGLGSDAPLPPEIGFTAAAQLVLGDRPGLAVTLITVLAVLFGVFGAIRLFRAWDLRLVPAVAGGLVAIAGPAGAALAAGTHWGGFVALGLLPWSVRGATATWPSRWRRRIGRIAGLGVIIGIMSAYAPALLPAPALLAGLWVLLGDGASWRSALASVVASAAGAALLMPWILDVDLSTYLDGPSFWAPNVIIVGVALGAGVLTLAAGPGSSGRVAGWGLVAAGVGGVVTRVGDWGRPAEAAGLAIASIGIAALVAAAFDAVASSRGRRRGVVAVAAVGAALVVVSTAWPMLPGRAGFPSSETAKALDLGSAGDASVRALLFGPADRLPGEERSLDGATYRVISVPDPTFVEIWLDSQRSADRALEEVLLRLVAGDTLRLGEELAPFGIKWIVVVDESPFEPFLEGQLDLVRLGRPDPTFRSEDPNAVRALTDSGEAWAWTGTGYEGPPADTVVLAENPDPRWGPPPWSQAGWANEVNAAEGFALYDEDDAARSAGLFSGALAILLLGLWLWGRGGG